MRIRIPQIGTEFDLPDGTPQSVIQAEANQRIAQAQRQQQNSSALAQALSGLNAAQSIPDPISAPIQRGLTPDQVSDVNRQLLGEQELQQRQQFVQQRAAQEQASLQQRAAQAERELAAKFALEELRQRGTIANTVEQGNQTRISKGVPQALDPSTVASNYASAANSYATADATTAKLPLQLGEILANTNQSNASAASSFATANQTNALTPYAVQKAQGEAATAGLVNATDSQRIYDATTGTVALDSKPNAGNQADIAKLRSDIEKQIFPDFVAKLGLSNEQFTGFVDAEGNLNETKLKAAILNDPATRDAFNQQVAQQLAIAIATGQSPTVPLGSTVPRASGGAFVPNPDGTFTYQRNR